MLTIELFVVCLYDKKNCNYMLTEQLADMLGSLGEYRLGYGTTIYLDILYETMPLYSRIQSDIMDFFSMAAPSKYNTSLYL